MSFIPSFNFQIGEMVSSHFIGFDEHVIVHVGFGFGENDVLNFAPLIYFDCGGCSFIDSANLLRTHGEVVLVVPNVQGQPYK